MKLKPALIIIVFISLVTFALTLARSVTHPPQTNFVIDTLATNLVVPWQIAFLPDSTMLFTEREGRVRIYRNGKLKERAAFIVRDIPLENKSGMLGLCLHPDFAKKHYLYLAFNYRDGALMKLRVERFEFRNDTLTNAKLILENIPANRNHTGCRLVFGPDKKLYITTGDADQAAMAQDIKAFNGKILRLNDDGSIPADNPFAESDTALRMIWSYGHRNPQGLAFQPGTNDLYDSEHGPTGGDEINLIRKGMNYGWPVVHHDDHREGMIDPLTQYTPSVGPSEVLFYKGRNFPGLNGKMLVACLRGECILVEDVRDGKIISQSAFLKKQYGRIRSIVRGPDGNIYFSTSNIDPAEGNGKAPFDMILRMRPSTEKGSRSVSGSMLPVNPQVATQTPKYSTQTMIVQLCGACHGNDLKGTAQIRGLVNSKLIHGDDRTAIIRNITEGITEKGMPAWKGAISENEIANIADYVLKFRRK